MSERTTNEFDLSGALEGTASAEVIPGPGQPEETKEK